MTREKRPLLYVVNNASFFLSHRLPLALAARERGFDVHVATPSGPAVPAILSLGLTHHEIPMSRAHGSPISELRSVLALYRLFRSQRPDVVHLVTIKPVLYGGIAARLAGVPSVVAAVSGLGFVFLRRGVIGATTRLVIRQLYRLAFANESLTVILQNPDDAETIRRLTRLPERRTVTIRGSGVDLTEYAVSPPPSGRPIVLMASRLLRDKGVREFVDAARMLKQRGVNATFRLAGDPDPANPASCTDQELAAWRREGIVELLGHREDVARLMGEASIVVLPSDREGMPRVLLEAAACGRPVVTTDVPGCRHAVEPGRSGLLVPVRDSGALAVAIERLVADPAVRERMGRAGRALAEREFSLERTVAAHLRIYESIGPLDRGGSGST